MNEEEKTKSVVEGCWRTGKLGNLGVAARPMGLGVASAKPAHPRAERHTRTATARRWSRVTRDQETTGIMSRTQRASGSRIVFSFFYRH